MTCRYTLAYCVGTPTDKGADMSKTATQNPALAALLAAKPTTGTTKVRSSEVRVGDRITEVNTPKGPFYTVTKVNPASFVLDGLVRLPFRSTDVVLRAGV